MGGDDGDDCDNRGDDGDEKSGGDCGGVGYDYGGRRPVLMAMATMIPALMHAIL